MGSDGRLNETIIQARQIEEKENNKHSITHQLNGLHQSLERSEGFVVDIEGFSHIIEKKDINANSRITTTNFSRNSSGRAVRDSNLLLTSPRATLQGISISKLEKPTLMESTDDHCIVAKPPQIQTHHHHHQISITNCNSSTASKRLSLRRPSIIIGPKRILLFFATLSCMGTILLIYFTLSMGQVNGKLS